jgi:hypothetical protein
MPKFKLYKDVVVEVISCVNYGVWWGHAGGSAVKYE